MMHDAGRPFFSQWGSVTPKFKIKCVRSHMLHHIPAELALKGRVQHLEVCRRQELRQLLPHLSRHDSCASGKYDQFAIRIRQGRPHGYRRILWNGLPISTGFRFTSVEVSLSPSVANHALSRRRAMGGLHLFDCM